MSTAETIKRRQDSYTGDIGATLSALKLANGDYATTLKLYAAIIGTQSSSLWARIMPIQTFVDGVLAYSKTRMCLKMVVGSAAVTMAGGEFYSAKMTFANGTLTNNNIGTVEKGVVFEGQCRMTTAAVSPVYLGASSSGTGMIKIYADSTGFEVYLSPFGNWSLTANTTYYINF